VDVHTVGLRGEGERHHRAAPTDVAALTAAARAAEPDLVFHLAGVLQAADPTAYYCVNAAYAAALLHALDGAGRGACPVLLVGTAAEYGRVADAELPVGEDTPARPVTHYGISKLAQTLLGLSLATTTGRPLVVARPFNLVGPGLPSHLAVASFARQIRDVLGGRRPPVVETGTLGSSRDFVDVGDAVEAYWRLVRCPAAYGQVVNVCTGREVTLGDALARLVALSGVAIEVRADAARHQPGEASRSVGDPGRLRRLLGWSPRRSLEESLARMLAEPPPEPGALAEP
jgi:GDP-4-dehydro-6-deoxy-D-mannose reductase